MLDWVRVLLLSLLLGLAFQPCVQYTGSPDGAIHRCGHAHRLICSRAGSPAACSGGKFDTIEFDRAEVRDENNRLQFSRSASPGEIFTWGTASGTGYPGHEIYWIGFTSRSLAGGTSPVESFYEFRATAEGLAQYHPSISCGTGERVSLSNQNLWPPMGIAEGCDFNTRHFRFTSVLTYDPDRLQIMVSPETKEFHVNSATDPLPGRLLPTAAQNATITAWPDHDATGQPTKLLIQGGQSVQVLGAWCPVTLDIDRQDVGTVHYDAANLWLEIERNGVRSWIHGDLDFHAIGLP